MYLEIFWCECFLTIQRLSNMVAPATKKPKTNDQALQPIWDCDHLVEDDSSDDSILAQPQATRLDDDSSSSNKDKSVTNISQLVEVITTVYCLQY